MFKITKNAEKPKNNLFKCFYFNNQKNLFSIKTTDITVGSSNEASLLSKDETNFLGKKMFKVKKQNMFNVDTGINNGIWTDEEHKKFIEALYIYNCKWYYIRKYIPTRAPEQIRSHAQKFYLRLKEFKDDALGLDFTDDSIQSLNEIIKIVKKKEFESIQNAKGNLLFIVSEKLHFGKKLRKKKKKPKRKSHIIKPYVNIDKKIDLPDDFHDNDYLWNCKDDSELPFDTFSFGCDLQNKRFYVF
jgi:SHAQKYF class myb-like DNA-binding protein